MLLGNLVPECCPLIGHRYCLLIGQLMPRVTLSQESGVTTHQVRQKDKSCGGEKYYYTSTTSALAPKGTFLGLVSEKEIKLFNLILLNSKKYLDEILFTFNSKKEHFQQKLVLLKL